MSKKKKNKKVATQTKKEETTIERLDNLQKKIDSKFEIIKQHKIFFWFILFPPVGIYKAIKYKLFNKWISIIIGVLVSLFLILSIDVVLHPNRVSDNIARKAVVNLGKLGEPRAVTKQGIVGDKYLLYDVLTTRGKYSIYFTVDGNNYEVDGIYKTIPEVEIIQEPSLLDDKIKSVFPQILVFFNNEENKNKYGNLEEVISTTGSFQEIKTSNGTYIFEVEFDGVTSIKSFNSEGEQEILYTREPIINLPNEVKKFLKKNKDVLGEDVTIISCVITDSGIEYIFKSDKSLLYKVEHKNDGTLILYNSDL